MRGGRSFDVRGGLVLIEGGAEGGDGGEGTDLAAQNKV